MEEIHEPFEEEYTVDIEVQMILEATVDDGSTLPIDEEEVFTLSMAVESGLADKAIGTSGAVAKDLLSEIIADWIVLRHEKGRITAQMIDGEDLATISWLPDEEVKRDDPDRGVGLPIFVLDPTDKATLQIVSVSKAES